MDVQPARISIGAPEKKDRLLAARRVRRALETTGVTILRGEYVRRDRRLYLDIAAVELPATDELKKATGVDAEVVLEPIPHQSNTDECLNCGNVADGPIVECPNCGFREISPCPNCNSAIARAEYLAQGADLFQCPTCHARVRLAYNEPLWIDDGRYNQPAVVVTLAAAPGEG